MLHRNSHTRISQPVFFSSLFLFSFFFYFDGRRWIAITVKRGNGLARMMHTLFSFFQIAFCHFLFPLSLWRCRFLLLYTVSSSSRCFLSGDQRRFTLRACWWFRGCRLACPSRKESSIHPTISLLFHSRNDYIYYVVVLHIDQMKDDYFHLNLQFSALSFLLSFS